MATKEMLKTVIFVAWFLMQMSTAVADKTEEDLDIRSNLIDGLDQIAKNIGKAYYYPGEKSLKEEEPQEAEKSSRGPLREPRLLWSEDPSEEKVDQDSEESPDVDGRLFIGANGLNGTTYTLNLQALTAAFGTAILIGLAIVIILLIIALATGRDISYVTKSIMDAADPFYYSKYSYNPPNYYDNYRDESTYEYYRAFEEAAKKFEEEN